MSVKNWTDSLYLYLAISPLRRTCKNDRHHRVLWLFYNLIGRRGYLLFTLPARLLHKVQRQFEWDDNGTKERLIIEQLAVIKEEKWST